MMNDMTFSEAAATSKDATVRSRYQAATLVNRELLSLYYADGRYVSDNSRGGYWGKGVIKQIYENLQSELPGLRGFSEVSIKRMRLFYEAWKSVFANCPLLTDDLGDGAKNKNRPLEMDEIQIVPNIVSFIDLNLLSRQRDGIVVRLFAADEFLRVGFTRHSEILAKEKSLDGRLFYVAQCAAEFWTVEAQKSNLSRELYTRTGAMPNNFLRTLPTDEQARRAILSFKDEYLLDFINIEDENYPDEKIIENGIVANIEKFILSFGVNKFCYMGHQHRLVVDGKEVFVDLLFFNLELHCLIAVELKRVEFKPSHLGQLNFYLSALDGFVKQDDEAPSIVILLCKEADRSFAEFAVRDYAKPMGVATYRTRNEMPETWKKALPDLDAMKALLEKASNEQISEVGE
jgi:predicted nuclease of restriction endonuclease-like (RecB) superfamily